MMCSRPSPNRKLSMLSRALSGPSKRGEDRRSGCGLGRLPRSYAGLISGVCVDISPKLRELGRRKYLSRLELLKARRGIAVDTLSLEGVR